MTFEAVRGQERAVAHLRAVVAHGRVPSAMLFLGPHGVGKRTAALALAQALNCRVAPGEGCGSCPACRKIAEGVHADVDVVAPDGQFIRIDQVRAVAERLALIPYEADKRVLIVREAERLHPAAANAFLKTLEEPPADTLLVLTAESAAPLLETIVSRCMPVRFGPLPPETVRAILAEVGGLSGEELDFAVRHAQGRLRAELQRHAGRLMVMRDEVLGALDEIDQLPFDRVAEQAQKWSGAEDWPFVLEVLESWYRDLLLLGGGAEGAGPVNDDRPQALARWARQVAPSRAARAHAQVLATHDALLLNVNRPLALEALWLNLKHTLTDAA